MLEVPGRLAEWLKTPDQTNLRRAFAATDEQLDHWVARILSAERLEDLFSAS